MKLTDLVNIPADSGNTPLHAVANSGNVKVAKLLLAVNEIDVNAVNPQCENATPLHMAVMHGRCENATPLHLAVMEGSLKFILRQLTLVEIR